MLSCFSCVWLFETLWIVAHQAPLSMGFSRQEYTPSSKGSSWSLRDWIHISCLLHWQAGSLPLTSPWQRHLLMWTTQFKTLKWRRDTYLVFEVHCYVNLDFTFTLGLHLNKGLTPEFLYPMMHEHDSLFLLILV